jgi:hypothetical protein
MRGIAKDEEVMGAHRLGRPGEATTAVAIGVIACSVLALGVLTAPG